MEGPSLLILHEEFQPFLKQKVLKVSGNTQQPKELLKGRTLTKIQTWGKNLFLTFSSAKKSESDILTKTHFMMFGSYTINKPKENRTPRLELKFKKGTLYFYACSIRFGAEDYLRSLDSEVDLMSKHWNSKHVLKLMQKKQNSYLCDLFLDQTVFAGSGNIIKNEVLFNLRCHPLTKLSEIPHKDWPKLVRAVHEYSWNFYEWKKKFELRRHWQVYRKFKCPLCQGKLIRENNGRLNRKSFFCPTHQPLLKNKVVKGLKLHKVLPMIEKSNKKEFPLEH